MFFLPIWPKHKDTMQINKCLILADARLKKNLLKNRPIKLGLNSQDPAQTILCVKTWLISVVSELIVGLNLKVVITNAGPTILAPAYQDIQLDTCYPWFMC